MINQWIAKLTTKQIVIYLMMIVVAIYIVWYVVDALEGFDPDYRPTAMGLGDNESKAGTKIKGGAAMFDPTKKTPEAIPSK